jgi:hypothetical protein
MLPMHHMLRMRVSAATHEEGGLPECMRDIWCGKDLYFDLHSVPE